MRHHTRTPLVLLVSLSACLLPAHVSSGADKPAADKLSAADRKMLADLLKEFLFDPRGAQRVQVKTMMRSVWEGSEEVVRAGWLVAGKPGPPARIYFADGDSIAAPGDKDLIKRDFAAECTARYARAGAAGEDRDPFTGMLPASLGVGEDADLTLAAWLHRLGHDDLAARALSRARREKDSLGRLRGDLAWTAYAGLVHAYMVRADEEALAHGQRLLRLYRREASANHPQAARIVADLQRRQKNGRFGKSPATKKPDGFDGWDVKKKAAYGIEALDEVDARQHSQPGGVDLASDPRVQALIHLGEAAVPQLIDAIEKDERLTRSVHFWRDFSRNRTVLSVREAALTAVMSILRVRVFEPASTGDNFTGRGEETAKTTAAQLRAYWKKYGGMPFDERMMAVLTDPRSNVEALREAADNLATLGQKRTFGTTVWTGSAGVRPAGRNPAVAKFKKPTAAEAILAAMDRDLAAHDRRPDDDLYDYRRRQIEDTYLEPLIELGDRRLAPVLVKRSAGAGTLRMRRKWAYAAHWLGDPRPLRTFAADFQAGRIKLPSNDKPNTNDKDQPGNVELRGIIGYLAEVHTAEADRALFALAAPTHPAHEMARQHILSDSVVWPDSRDWFAHPFCVTILRRALDDTTPTGAMYRIEGKNLKRLTDGGWGSGGIPALLADPAVRKDSAAELVRDQAAEQLQDLVRGLPAHHPLLKDADKRLRLMKDTLDRFQGRYRALDGRKVRLLGAGPWHAVFVPDIRPLGRAATAADVKAGRAIFHLDGKGKPADLQLPAVAVLPNKRNEKETNRVLIVQAETRADGELICGVIGRHEVRAVRGAELADIKPLREKPKPKGEKKTP